MGIAVGQLFHHERPWPRARIAWPFARQISRSATLGAPLHLTRGERVITRFAGTDGGHVVGTDRALYWCPAGAAWVRLGWEEIAWVEADRGTGATLVVALPAGTPWRGTMSVQGGQALLSFAQERVTATRVTRTHIAVGGQQLWVEARRQPATGQIHWLVRLDHGLDSNDPALRSKIAEAVEELRGDLGV